MLETESKLQKTHAIYAVPSDFCRIFQEDMTGLYTLSLLLTADPGKAEQCFVAGLGESTAANRVFREWARSWACRTIVQSAIRMIAPAPEPANNLLVTRPVTAPAAGMADSIPFAAIIGLAPFERFVFVMTVLERYSDQECSVLLGSSRRDVAVARAQAAQHITNSVQSHAMPAPSGSHGIWTEARSLAQSA